MVVSLSAASFSLVFNFAKINIMLTLTTHSLVGVDPGVPAQQLQEFIIEAQGEGDAHGCQTDVRENGDDAELEDAGQADHQAREHHAGLPHVPPVHQIHDWTHTCGQLGQTGLNKTRTAGVLMFALSQLFRFC